VTRGWRLIVANGEREHDHAIDNTISHVADAP
jgi:hypothetical protein